MARMTIEHPRFEEMKLSAKGRNGFMKCRGVEVGTLYYGKDHLVTFNPITSYGATSDAARIEIPAEALSSLIAVLQAAHAEHLRSTDRKD